MAFVTADVPDFSSATSGNIWITRVDVDDGNPENNYYKQLNAADDPLHRRKRTEPEVHYPVNDMPVVFYSQEAANGDGSGCDPGVNMLRRVRTFPLPPPE